MRACFIICLVFLATVAYSANGDGVIGSRKILRLNPSNAGDVYIIGNFLACIKAYTCYNNPIALELDTPIDFIAQSIFIYEFEGKLIFFNQLTSKLILIIPQVIMDEILELINVTLDLYRLPLEAAFNSYLGINNVILSKSCNDFFNFVGNIIAELLGVGAKPVSAINLNGLVDFQKRFPSSLAVFQPNSVIVNIKVQSSVELSLYVASKSIIVDYVAYTNKNLVFNDIIFPGRTLSGYKIGNILGKKNLCEIIPVLMGYIIELLPFEDVSSLLNQLITSIIIDSNPEKIYEDFFLLIIQYSAVVNGTSPITT